MNSEMMPKLKYRHELKYLISEAEKYQIIKVLSMILSADMHTVSNNEYFIRSLYFDDMWGSSYKDKMAGVNSRKKYRIRIYNNSDSVIKLECKRKEGQFINKISAWLSREEADMMIAGKYDFLLYKPERVCRKFYYDNIIKRMNPRVIVDYKRNPYVLSYGDVRITFDSDLRAGIMSYDIFDPNIVTMKVMQPDMLIMEVKYTEYLPTVVQQLLPVSDAVYTSASKYTLCMSKKMEYR